MFPAYPTVGLKPLYFSWYVVMLVGLGNVPGAIIGGFIVALIQTATQQFLGIAWEDVVPTALMIVVTAGGAFGHLRQRGQGHSRTVGVREHE